MTERDGWLGVQTDAEHILILGGTREARMMAETLARHGLRVTYALHSPTGTVAPPHGCELHVGSFGGEKGLVVFIKDQAVTVFANALHPHAVVMQRRAQSIAQMAHVPYFRLERSLWQPEAGDNWQEFEWVEELNHAVRDARHRKLFLTVGPQALRVFHPLSQGAELVARRFDARRGDQMDFVTWINGLPNPSLDDEIALFSELKIGALVTKNSGGTRPKKLDAAAHLNLPVYMLRPQPLEGPSYSDWQKMSAAILAVTVSG